MKNQSKSWHFIPALVVIIGNMVSNHCLFDNKNLFSIRRYLKIARIFFSETHSKVIHEIQVFALLRF